ncbi:hypothetical protein GCM10023189_42720 [Nibrella saemangeumensis]|uniref:DUF2846 domain-containing protein n=1 Tax=Nibrella saemangeumensis TaxID=1084526 RepID=A0ABP8NDK7_9BACT
MKVWLNVLAVLLVVIGCNRSPQVLAFDNQTTDTLLVTVRFIRPHFYNGEENARLLRRVAPDTAVFDKGVKQSLPPGRYVFEVVPHHYLYLGKARGKNDNFTFNEITVQQGAFRATYDLPRLKAHFFKQSNAFTFHYR